MMAKTIITAADPMATILSKWPETIPVFLAYKMSCIGCYMSSFDTLEEALAVHGLPVDDLVDELNQAVIMYQAQTKGRINE